MSVSRSALRVVATLLATLVLVAAGTAVADAAPHATLHKVSRTDTGW